MFVLKTAWSYGARAHRYNSATYDFCAYCDLRKLSRPWATGDNVANYIVDVVNVKGRQQRGKKGKRVEKVCAARCLPPIFF